jgi:hypothetical protein
MVTDLAFEHGLAADQVGAGAARVPQFPDLSDGHPETAQCSCELWIVWWAGRR